LKNTIEPTVPAGLCLAFLPVRRRASHEEVFGNSLPLNKHLESRGQSDVLLDRPAIRACCCAYAIADFG
jgi:hypothetical protein